MGGTGGYDLYMTFKRARQNGGLCALTKQFLGKIVGGCFKRVLHWVRRRC